MEILFFLVCLSFSAIVTYLGDYVILFIVSKFNITNKIQIILVKGIVLGMLLYIAFRIILYIESKIII